MQRSWALILALFLPAAAFSQTCPLPAHEWPADGNGQDIVGGIDAVVPDGVSYASGHKGQAFSFDGSGPFACPSVAHASSLSEARLSPSTTPR